MNGLVAGRGDRIRLTATTKDRYPIKAGSIGEVAFVHPVSTNYVLSVRWENGRTTALIWPEDHFTLELENLE